MSSVVAEVAVRALSHTEPTDVVCVTLEGEGVVPATGVAGLSTVLGVVPQGTDPHAPVGGFVGEGPLGRRAVTDTAPGEVVCEGGGRAHS